MGSIGLEKVAEGHKLVHLHLQSQLGEELNTSPKQVPA